MTEQFVAGLLLLLEKLDVPDLKKKLETNPLVVDAWKTLTEEQWTKHYKLEGCSIYNYFHGAQGFESSD